MNKKWIDANIQKGEISGARYSKKDGTSPLYSFKDYYQTMLHASLFVYKIDLKTTFG